jgi:peptide methionine sulfoxide reductase MsrA
MAFKEMKKINRENKKMRDIRTNLDNDEKNFYLNEQKHEIFTIETKMKQLRGVIKLKVVKTDSYFRNLKYQNVDIMQINLENKKFKDPSCPHHIEVK